MTAPRIVHLEVNDSGVWRRVTSFDLNEFEDGALEYNAGTLFCWSTNERLKARIIIPGDTAPLVTWTREHGWREWAHPGERQGVL